MPGPPTWATPATYSIPERAAANCGGSTQGGWTALHWAAEHGHVAVVNALLSRGANVNTRGFVSCASCGPYCIGALAFLACLPGLHGRPPTACQQHKLCWPGRLHTYVDMARSAPPPSNMQKASRRHRKQDSYSTAYAGVPFCAAIIATATATASNSNVYIGFPRHTHLPGSSFGKSSLLLCWAFAGWAHRSALCKE